ncbi:MAG: AAA family ATPase [Polyangiaceae bacterium]|nr:AAA family ATPase [Polyangiaceae bacterium]
MPSSSDLLGLDGDEEGRRVVREELKLLSMVTTALDRSLAVNMDALRARQNDDGRLLELREEVASAKPEDLPALFEQMHHVGALRAQRGKGVIGAIDRTCPYFAHLRLEENGKRRDVLVGTNSYVDTAAGVRIVDWRNAPVSRIFYRYSEGEDYEETLGDRMVEGLVLARRSVAIQNGELIRVSSPQGTFIRSPDKSWKRIDVTRAKLRGPKEPARLGVGADGKSREDKHLPAIASMLDTKQFELITKPGAGLIAIQGSAGSGKTTVGLHRVAYLNFTEPDKYRADKLLVIVPSDALRHYVARVLPSLGVEGVSITTFARVASRLMPTLFPKLPVDIHKETPALVTRAKTSARVLHGIAAFANEIHDLSTERIEETMRKWSLGELVIDAWKGLGKLGLTPDARMVSLTSWVQEKKTFEGLPSAADVPASTKSALEPVIQDLRRGIRDIPGAWDELFTSRERLGTMFAGELGPTQIDRLHEWCVFQARVRAERERDGEIATLDFEDNAVLLRLWQALRGPLTDPSGAVLRFSHIFVDEVQDSNPVELRVLLDLSTKDRSITLSGDIAQQMLTDDDDRGEFDWKTLLSELDMSATTIEPLRVSYRSTAEITAFARGVLGPLAHEEIPETTRSGPPVELFAFASIGESVAFIADALKELSYAEPSANIALVSRFTPHADMVYQGLVRAEVPNLRRVAKQDFTWEAGVDVTDVRQTKGLEFDEVILLETTASCYPDTPQARHALYVASTRASHQLWCVASEKPSPTVLAALQAGQVSTPTQS